MEKTEPKAEAAKPIPFFGFTAAHTKDVPSMAVGADGTLYMLGPEMMSKLEPGEDVALRLLAGGAFVPKAGATAPSLPDRGVMDNFYLSAASDLSIPYNSNVLYFNSHVRVKKLEDGEVCNVTKARDSPGLSWFQNGCLWIHYPWLNRIAKLSPGRTTPEFITKQASMRATQMGPLSLAALGAADRLVSIPAHAPRSGAVYLAMNHLVIGGTDELVAILRIWNGFVQHVAGGAKLTKSAAKSDARNQLTGVLRPSPSVSDGPIHKASFEPFTGIVVNSQEDIIVSSSKDIRLISRGLVSTLHSVYSSDTMLKHDVLGCSPYTDIFYSFSNVFVPTQAIQKLQLEQPWNRLPAGIPFRQLEHLLAPGAASDTFFLRVNRDPMRFGALRFVDSRVDPNKLFTIASPSNNWQFHRDLLSIRCPLLLTAKVQTAFSGLSERVQDTITSFILDEQISPPESIADAAELDVAATLLRLDPLSVYLKSNIRAAVLDLYDAQVVNSLAELVQRIPEEVCDIYIEIFAQRLRRDRHILEGASEELKQLSPNPQRNAVIIAKLLAPAAPPSNITSRTVPLDELRTTSAEITVLLPWYPTNERLQKLGGIPTEPISKGRSANQLLATQTPLPFTRPPAIKKLRLTKPVIEPDFTIICGSIHFPCHKWILLARWPYFNKWMSNALATAKGAPLPDSLSISTVRAEFMETLLIWFYCGDNSVFSTVENCMTFIQFGAQLDLVTPEFGPVQGMESLHKFCLRGAVSDLHVSTVVFQLRVAQLIQDEQSITRCVIFIASHIGAVMSTGKYLGTWQSIGAELLIRCFQKSYSLNNNPTQESYGPSQFFVDTVAGNGNNGNSSGATHRSTFERPSGICMGSHGELYISDTGNSTIRVLHPGAHSGIVAGTGVEGYNFGTLDKAQFAMPLGLGRGPDGDIFVADFENDRIRTLRLQVGDVKTFCGVGRKGAVPSLLLSSSPKPLKESEVTLPTALCFDGNRMFISQNARHCILVATSGMVSLFAGHSDPIEKSDWSSKTESKSLKPYERWRGCKNGPRLQAEFDCPHGLCMSSNGDILVADSGNHCIRAISETNVRTIVGIGTQAGFLDGDIQTALLHFPTDVAAINDRLYICDSANHCIRMLIGTTLSTVAGNGSGGFSNGFLQSSQLYFPSALCLGNEGEIYVADTSNNAIRVVREVTGHAKTTIPTAAPSSFQSPSFCAMQQLTDEVDVKWTHRPSGTAVGLHSLVLRLRLPHLLEDDNDDLTNLLINNEASGEAFLAFVSFLYTDNVPSNLDNKTFSQLIVLFSLSGHPSFMEHAQLLLHTMIASLKDANSVMTILKSLLAQQVPTELLDMVVPKLRSNTAFVSPQVVGAPGMPSRIIDVLSKVADRKANLSPVPAFDRLATQSLSSLVKVLVPDDLMPHVGAAAPIPSSSTPSSSGNMETIRDFLRASIPCDTLITTPHKSILAHSLILLGRWPACRQWMKPMDAENLLKSQLPSSVIRHLMLPDAPTELINAILLHVYCDRPLDLRPYSPRDIEILCATTPAPQLPPSPVLAPTPANLTLNITLENCANMLMLAITNHQPKDEEKARIFIQARLGFILHHPSIGEIFRRTVPPNIIASLLMANYGLPWSV